VKKFFLSAAFVLAASTAHAQERSLLASIVAGNVADIASTRIALGSGNAVEGNPLMRGSRLYVVKGAGTAFEVYMVHRMWSTGHKRSAIITTIALTAANGFIAAHNFSVR
jgi:hypothetical protein